MAGEDPHADADANADAASHGIYHVAYHEVGELSFGLQRRWQEI
jgi:hypothetical protein